MTLLTKCTNLMAYKIGITASSFPKLYRVKMVADALYLIIYGFDCTTILGGMRYLINMHHHLIGSMVSGTDWYNSLALALLVLEL